MVKTEAFDGINSYLSELSGTPVKSLADVVAFNDQNHLKEGANPGDHQAFPSGQDNFREILDCGGHEREPYKSALEYIQQKSRQEGIDAALRIATKESSSTIELDALLMCDKLGVGQQIAAQAGKYTDVLLHGYTDQQVNRLPNHRRTYRNG